MNTTNYKSLCLLLVAIAFFGCADIPDDLRNGACNGQMYTEYQFCAEGKVYDLCGGTPYNPSSVACCNNHQYTISTEFCYGGLTIYRRCGGSQYDPSTQKCQNDVVQSLSSSSVDGYSSSSSSVKVSSSSFVHGCKENNPKAGFTCGWNVTGVLTPGTVLKPANPAAPSGCSVVWRYAPGTNEMVLAYECNEVPAEGFAALGSRNYVLFAELTCDGVVQTTACDPKDGLPSEEDPNEK